MDISSWLASRCPALTAVRGTARKKPERVRSGETKSRAGGLADQLAGNRPGERC